MSEPTPESEKIQSLEGLRGVMAWRVVVGHISLAFGWSLPLIDRNGLAVDVFILLSGFVIARMISRKHEDYGVYIARRAFRLFPLYLVVLAISAIALPIQLSAWQNLAYDTWSNGNRVYLAQEALQNVWLHLSVHLPLAQGLMPKFLTPDAAYTIVGQSWSISLEWQFYILAPVLLWTLGDWRRMPVLIVLIVALGLLSVFFTGAFLGAKIMTFMVGILTYVAINATANRWKWVGGTALFAAAMLVFDGRVQVVPLAIWLIVIVANLKFGKNPFRWVSTLLSSRPAVHLGEISYSVYLVHMIPLWGSIWVFQQMGLQGRVLELSVLTATVVLAYVFARITYATVEKPGIRAGARATRVAVRTGVVSTAS